MPSGLIVNQDTLGTFAEGANISARASRLGLQVVEDFYLHMALIGASFQIRAGTITTPLVGDVPITDTRAEYCVDAAAGITIIPVYGNISLRLMATLALEMGIKSVGAVSSAGTAFVPLPLKTVGPRQAATPTAAVSTARVAAHAVTVTAELATTTRRHWSYANPTGNTTAGTNLGIYNGVVPDWAPRMPPILAGPVCLYCQIAAATTGPSYYASLDYIEAPTATLL